MKEILKCLEHETIRIISNRQSGQRAIDKSQAGQIEKLGNILPRGAFSWGRDSIKWSQYCGVIQLDRLTIEILPKIYGIENKPDACRDALIHMLKRAQFLRTYRGVQANINQQKHTLLDVFILHFCEELDIQLTQGLLREYIEIEDNLKVIKGRLLIESQLKHNLVQKERLYCRYDEFDKDIPINQIIKYTLQILFRLAHSQRIRKLVNGLLMHFDKVNDVSITVEDIDCLTFDRTNNRYQSVLNQCRMFIEGFPDVMSGQGKAFSLLFDMNRLFESWTAAMLKPIAKQLEMKLRLQKPKKYFGYWEGNRNKVFQLQPDITFSKGKDKVEIIADAKWKILDDAESKMGISQNDLYQIQSYANRYEVNTLKLFYPKQNKLIDRKKLVICGKHESELEIIPLDITKQKDTNCTLYDCFGPSIG